MKTQPPEIFAVCPMDAVPIGAARAFDLARVDDSGEARPFRIFIVREKPTTYRGYVNACPHEGVWLNIGSGRFFDSTGSFLRCGKHGAAFNIATGLCVDGPCAGAHLEPVAVVAINGVVCIAGVRLLEEESERRTDAADETMEITVHSG